MKYMGSKRELLERIEDIVDSKLTSDQIFLDIFAGTCGVGIYLKDKYPIYSNDVQLYSKIISEGTIEATPTKITPDQVWDLLKANYEKNYRFVSLKLSKYLKKSNSFKETGAWSSGLLKAYLEFIKKVPSPTKKYSSNSSDDWLTSEYRRQGLKGRSFPYVQTTYLFGEMYFSLEQAIAIDSLKYAIDRLAIKQSNIAKILHVSLIHAYSYCSAGTGHFAQFRDLSTLSSITDVFLYRTRSVLDYFFRKTEEIIEASKKNTFYKRNKSFSTDYREILKNNSVMKRVGLVYADPPYTFVHYSRFYHAIENLCRYDYPAVEHKGRYRMDRHQSPFCIKTQAPDAFKEIFEKTSRYKTPVLISYSNTGMIQLDHIKKIASEHGYKIALAEIDHKHSTMGRLKDKTRDVKEALLLCH